MSKSEAKQGRYDFTAIEARWQKYWDENGVFRTANPGEPGARTDRPKFYVLDMFPYPSGAGLHVGHPLGYCATDIIARYKRMRGFNVLHPMGFDSFGLPAEQYAIEHNVHPAETTRRNIDTYRRQLKMFGFSYDWSRELATSDPAYYKFTQWCFARMFESWYDGQCQWVDPGGKATVGRARPIAELVAELESGRWGVDDDFELVRTPGGGRREWASLSDRERREAINRQRLAFLDEIPVNWCPALGTVLANEEVDSEGRSERGGHPVYRRPLKQWMLRITRYAERLLADLDELEWPEPIKLMQRNWVGRSTGAEVVFPLAEGGENGPHGGRDGAGQDGIRIYTTRPDTLFGATYMVLAPEHELVERVTTPDRAAEVRAYVEVARHRSDLERTAETKEKTGVFTGGYAINPVNGCKVPIWIADYVLMGYGTGAIMAVPASDSRDFEFALKFDLPIIPVVQPTAEWILERFEALARAKDEASAQAFARIVGSFPELEAMMAETGAGNGRLRPETVRRMVEVVGAERLLEHYLWEGPVWGAAYIEPGVAVNSPRPEEESADVPGGVCSLNGLPTSEAKARITEWLEKVGVGRAAVNYKLRDWVFSRQKYWGEPFPVLHEDGGGETVALADEELPLELPPMEDFKPTPAPDDAEALPEPPLGRAKAWVTVERDGRRYRRDLNTMPQWAGSCWYYLRFIDPRNEERFCDPAAEKYWMPVDLYVGGAEHAVLHLLYARFWHKVLLDLGHVSTREPFMKLFNQGMIQSFAARTQRGTMAGVKELGVRHDDGTVTPFTEEQGHQFVDDTLPAEVIERVVRVSTGEPVTRVIAKMSKALKNVVNPDEIIGQYGADTFRLYEMYMGPLDASKPWNTRDVPGLFKLCQRIWRLVMDEETGELSAALVDDAPDEDALRVLHKTIKRVQEDVEQLKFNTAIAALFDFVNTLTPMGRRPRAVIEPFLLVLAPFAPHLAEELWRRLGHGESLAWEPWPALDEALARDESVEIAVQVGGKLKSKLMMPADADEDALREAALADERVRSAIAGKTVRKVIVVKGRLVNIVAG